MAIAGSVCAALQSLDPSLPITPPRTLDDVVGASLIAGLGLGLVLALALTRLLEGLVYGVSTTDPLTFVSLPIVLGAVAFLAGLFPALRASRIDPLEALRVD